MVIARLIKEKLSSTPAGVVLTTRDFGVEMRYQPALAKALNRLVLQGELQKIAKGKYGSNRNCGAYVKLSRMEC